MEFFHGINFRHLKKCLKVRDVLKSGGMLHVSFFAVSVRARVCVCVYLSLRKG